MKEIIVITSMPEIFTSMFSCGVIGTALKKNLWSLKLVNLYDFGLGAHKKIDDTVYGGGCGMLITAGVVSKAVEYAQSFYTDCDFDIIYLSPRGEKFNQSLARDFSHSEKPLCIICGRFEGIDQRVINYYDMREISIGDFVLSNGEIASAIVIDSIIRLMPNVLGNSESSEDESFSITGENNIKLLECDKYTKPAAWNGLAVPDVLLSGNHLKIKEWNEQNSLRVTKNKRPDFFYKN